MLKLFIIVSIFLSNSLFSFFDGVYQLSVVDTEGRVLSLATGFAIDFKGKHVLSSYHLLDNHILEADKIFMDFYGEKLELKITGYDDLRDILVLETNDQDFLDSDFLEFGSCKKFDDLDIVGFRKSRQFLINSEERGDTKLKGFYTLDTFLPKGFSGSPVLSSEDLDVCGMVILSDKEDANSVYVAKEFLSKVILNSRSKLSVSEHRIKIGLEYVVHNNIDLYKLSKRSFKRQVIVNIIGDDYYTLRNEENLIINFLNKENQGIQIVNSKNIYINGMHGGRLLVKNSEAITIANSIFSNQKYGIFLINSSNMLISNNKFVSLNNGILIKDINNTKLNSIFVQRNLYKKVHKKLFIVS